MNTHAEGNDTNESAWANFLLTPEFTPVIAGLYGQKPFKRLPACPSSATRLKPGGNEK
ncbi:MAG TPA: hypothetical protein VH254_03905 [Candidatus Udaeobacter sp.]|jgi:hypothetical protein|nr:hypothetical protein [Candidatus Udaeobacter sp.]